MSDPTGQRRGEGEADFGYMQTRDANATQQIRAENQDAFLSTLPERLRALWDNPLQLVDMPPLDFYREADASKRETLIREFSDELILIARRCIQPKREDKGEWMPWMTPVVEREITQRVNDPRIQDYALDRVLERHKIRYIDPLTGGLSKAGLEQRFYTEIKRLETLPDDRVMVLIEFDIDSFKKVNQRLGHSGADKMLIKLTAEIKSVISELDSIGRRSGDELSIILNNVDPEALPTILQRITTAANSIEFTQELNKSEEQTGEFMSITGSARVIQKGEPISYEQASKEADAGATFQKVNKPGSIVRWSPNLRPDLSTEEKREEWAEKQAANHIKRDTDALYAELRKYSPDSEQYEMTERQIASMEEAREHWTGHYLTQIQKEHGPLGNTEQGEPPYARSKKERELRAAMLARSSLEARFREQQYRLAEAATDEARQSAREQVARLEEALAILTKYEMMKLDARYGEATEP